jgi:hypothetical protein
MEINPELRVLDEGMFLSQVSHLTIKTLHFRCIYLFERILSEYAIIAIFS